MNYKQKYRKYKNKYLNLKNKKVGGAKILELTRMDASALPVSVEDIIDGNTHTFSSFFALDAEDNLDRRIAFLVDDSVITVFPLYVSEYNTDLVDNSRIFYKCKTNLYDPDAVTSDTYDIITSNNITGHPLFQLTGIRMLYIDIDSMKYIKECNHKFWLFSKSETITRIVSRAIVLDQDNVEYEYDHQDDGRENYVPMRRRNLDNQLFNASAFEESLHGTTRCIESTYDVYNVQKLVIITETMREIDDEQIESISDLIIINYNIQGLSYDAVNVYVQDFFRLYPEKKFIEYNPSNFELLLNEIYQFIIKTMKPSS